MQLPLMCPDWGLNRRSFCLQDSAQSIEPHQPGPSSLFSLKMLFHCISMVLNPVRPNALLKKKKGFIYLFLERVREGEREGEKYQCVVASRAPPTGHPACNQGICPDWELNRLPFGSQAGNQSTDPQQPGPLFFF